MSKGWFVGGGETGKRGPNKPPRTDGRHNGGNPPGCLAFIGYMLLLSLGVVLLLAYVNTRG